MVEPADLPDLAAAMVSIILAGLIEVLPSRVHIRPGWAGQCLDPFDRPLTEDVRRTRRTVRDPEIVAAVGRCLTEYAELVIAIRSQSAHLLNNAVQRTDRQLRALVQEALWVAHDADQNGAAAVDGQVPPDQAQARAQYRRDRLAYLDRVAQ